MSISECDSRRFVLKFIQTQIQDMTLHVQWNGASQQTHNSRRDLQLVNQRHRWQNEPRWFQGVRRERHSSGEREEAAVDVCWCWPREAKNTGVSADYKWEADDLLSAVVGHHVNIVLDYGANVSGRPHHWTDTGLTFGKYSLFF